MVAAFHRPKSTILVEEVTDEDFKKYNKALNVNKIFKDAKDVRAIASAHQNQCTNGTIFIHNTSQDGYDSASMK